MQFAYLGSGSRGNAAVVEAGRTGLMIDCGFSVKETVRRLARLQRDGSALNGILVTHEHSDHVAGVGAVARHFNVPVWATAGTLLAGGSRFGNLPAVQRIEPEQVFVIGDIEITPYRVPHDAREPVQFVLSDGYHRLGLLSDAGQPTPHIESVLSGCDSLALECNYDREMLLRGPYPPVLKSRIAGDLGHMDNTVAAALLSRLDTDRLQHLVAVHLSETNNTPALARRALCATVGCNASFVQVADQELGLPWHALA